MILVDTSVWAEFFNGADTPRVEHLDRVLRDEVDELATMPIIVTETLQGFRDDRSFDVARALLCGLHVIVPSLDAHVRAAHLFRSLRREGVTVRGAVDCLIAQACIDEGALLLARDRDFEHIARHTALRVG